jgi:hypothetical protein
MKYTLSILFIFVCSFFAKAQQNPINYYFDEYKHLDGVTTVSVPRPLIWLATFFVDENEDQETKKILRQINSVKVITIENARLNKEINFLEDLKRMKESKSFKRKYEELLTVKEKNEEVAIYCHEKSSGKIGELLLIVHDGENTAVRIKGNLDPKILSSLNKSMKVDGMEHFGKLDHSKKVAKK